MIKIACHTIFFCNFVWLTLKYEYSKKIELIMEEIRNNYSVLEKLELNLPPIGVKFLQVDTSNTRKPGKNEVAIGRT